jgi:hypothetical protein
MRRMACNEMCQQPDQTRSSIKVNGVRWSPDATLRVFEEAQDLTNCDKWYSREDFKTFSADCRTTISFARKGMASMGAEVCTRGLEHMISVERYQLRKFRRFHAVEAVWNEQVCQFYSGVSSTDSIAEVYRSVAISCQIEAHRRAVQYFNEDQFEAGHHAEGDQLGNMMSDFSLSPFQSPQRSARHVDQLRKKQITARIA